MLMMDHSREILAKTVIQETLEPKENRVQAASSLLAIKENQETTEKMVYQELPDPRYQDIECAYELSRPKTAITSTITVLTKCV